MISAYVDIIGADVLGRVVMHRGQFNDVVLTDDAVYRFPRTEEGRRQLGRHAENLTTVRRVGLAVTVPTLLTLDGEGQVGRCHLAMTRVAGTPARSAGVPRVQVVDELATLIRILCDAGSDALTSGVAVAGPDKWLRFGEDVRQTLFPLMSVAGRRRAAEELEAVDTVASGGEALVHGDLGGDNLLWHPGADGRLASVVDWDDVSVGDPANDVASLAATFGWGVAGEALARTMADPQPVLTRARAIARTFGLQQAVPAALSCDSANLQAGLEGYR